MLVSDFKFITNSSKISAYQSGGVDGWFSLGKIRLKVMIILGLLTLGILSAQLVFASILAVHGQRVSQIEQEINKLTAENTLLEVAIAKESSLVSLSEKAQKLGFVKPPKTSFP